MIFNITDFEQAYKVTIESAEDPCRSAIIAHCDSVIRDRPDSDKIGRIA